MIYSGFDFAGNFLKRPVYLLLLLLFSGSLWGQEKPTRQSATEAFDRGEYNLAYRQFSELLVSFPKDPVYKYYKAACMVNMEADPTEASKLLNEARQSASLSRPLPLESLFFLGRAKQQAAQFTEAISAYNEYTDQAGKKASRDMGVPTFVSQCEGGEGALPLPYKVININDSGNAVITQEQIPEEKVTVHVEPVATQHNEEATTVVSPVTMERKLMPADYDTLLEKAVYYQRQTDSLSLLMERQQEGLSALQGKDRTVLTSGIARNRVMADSLQTIADDKFEAAQQLINGSMFTEERDIVPVESKITPEKQPDPIQEPQEQPLTAAVKQDSISTIVAQSVKALPGVTTMFEVDDKLVTSKDEIIINPELPQGLVYRIQIAILRNPANQSTFKGLSPVYGLRDAASTSTKYYVGLFRRRTDANTALNEVKKVGFTDAFIIALLSGNSISTERAASLEKEWENVPFAYTDVGMQDVVADTVPPVLSYRVELMRVKQPVKEDQLNMMKRIAGTRGMDIFTLESGDIVYLVGTFVTYDSAVEFADLVSRNGFPAAKVAAWLGRREIPLETARQLFDMI